MIPSGFCGGLNDPVLGQPEVIAPATHMGFGWPALPPGGQGAVRIKAQGVQQLCEKPIKIRLARSCVLLLRYWFSYSMMMFDRNIIML